MPARGETQTLVGEFVDTGGTPADATSVVLQIFHGEDLVAGPFTVFEHPATGIYSYDWLIPLDAEVGTYLAYWTGQTSGVGNVGTEEFEVTSFYTAPGWNGCPWPIDESCLDSEWDELTEEQKSRGVMYASVTLHRLTGHRVGGCPVTVRPIMAKGACFVPFIGQPGTAFSPGVIHGRWVNCGMSPTTSATGCEVELPAPVGRIDEVKVDGVVLSPVDYTVQSGRYLVWMGDGDCPFPTTQDLSKPDTEEGTFSVTYLNSYPPDAVAAGAAARLALEFGKACAGSNKCRLPKGTISVVRRGVAIEIQRGLFHDGFTGFKEVDAFIELWNPKGLVHEAQVWTPDMHTPRTVR